MQWVFCVTVKLQMKKILIVINNYEEVSHNRHLLRLIKFLSKENLEVNLSVLKKDGKLKNEFESIPKVILIKPRNVKRFLKSNTKTVILTKELRSEYFIFILRFILGWSNYKHLTIRPSFGFLNESLWKIIKNIFFYFSLFLVDVNIAVGETIANRIISIKKNKTIYIPNSLDDNFLLNNGEHLMNIKKINFIYTGFLEKRKNLNYTIELISSLSNDFTFTILGNGTEINRLTNLAKTKKIQNKVNFLGHVENVKKYLDNADVFIFLTKMEGLSLSLLEAMSRGLICIVSDIPENRELISDMKNGILLPLDNKKQAIKKLETALKNKEALIKISKNAKQTIIDKYTDNKSFRMYKRLLKS